MKRVAAALMFFTASLAVFFGLGAAYVVLTERVCAVDWCADPQRLMVYPQIANGPNVHLSPFYRYGPRE
ncbi:MAG TPA: hypothetical protein VHV82_07915 [Sporichthyaceae bacterium]|jgi:hypothetical protein|nr:hypothetical protein [Sporichthyaceae bacterium]